MNDIVTKPWARVNKAGPKCETCGDTRIKYTLDKGYKSVEYAPPEAITEIPCPDCKPEQPNLKIIGEIECLISQVNGKLGKLDEISPGSKEYSDEQKRLIMRSQALEEIDKFQKTTLHELRKAFE